jgi:ribonuclease P protein component
MTVSRTAVGDFSFQRHERLTGPDFKRAQRQGRRRVGRILTLWAFRRPGVPARAARLGIVVGRRHGGAVQRNLFKRRTREAFRNNKPWPRGWDLVVAPKTPGPFPPAFAPLRDDLLETTRKLGVLKENV